MPPSSVFSRKTRGRPHITSQPQTSKTTPSKNKNRASSASKSAPLLGEANTTINTLQRIDKRELTKDAAQFVMASATTKGLVREPDLRKLLEATGRASRDGQIEVVSKNLRKAFGYELLHDEAGARYFLGTDLQLPPSALLRRVIGENGDVNNANLQDERIKTHKEGVLITALMFIFMVQRHLHAVIDNEHGIGLCMLREFLNDVALIEEDTFASWFGPSRTAEFLTHGWLECIVKRDVSGENEISFNWGPRAETVIDKRQMLEAFCKLYGSQVGDWPRHAAAAGIDLS